MSNNNDDDDDNNNNNNNNNNSNDNNNLTLKHLAAVILWFLLKLNVILGTFLKKKVKIQEKKINFFLFSSITKSHKNIAK